VDRGKYYSADGYYILINAASLGWRFGLVVTRWPRSTKLRYVRPGYYQDR